MLLCIFTLGLRLHFLLDELLVLSLFYSLKLSLLPCSGFFCSHLGWFFGHGYFEIFFLKSLGLFEEVLAFDNLTILLLVSTHTCIKFSIVRTFILLRLSWGERISRNLLVGLSVRVMWLLPVLIKLVLVLD